MAFSADSSILSKSLQGTPEQCSRFILARQHGEYNENDIINTLMPAYFAV